MTLFVLTRDTTFCEGMKLIIQGEHCVPDRPRTKMWAQSCFVSLLASLMDRN
jgi:hypothetical protein